MDREAPLFCLSLELVQIGLFANTESPVLLQYKMSRVSHNNYTMLHTQILVRTQC